MSRRLMVKKRKRRFDEIHSGCLLRLYIDEHAPQSLKDLAQMIADKYCLKGFSEQYQITQAQWEIFAYMVEMIPHYWQQYIVDKYIKKVEQWNY